MMRYRKPLIIVCLGAIAVIGIVALVLFYQGGNISLPNGKEVRYRDFNSLKPSPQEDLVSYRLDTIQAQQLTELLRSATYEPFGNFTKHCFGGRFFTDSQGENRGEEWSMELCVDDNDLIRVSGEKYFRASGISAWSNEQIIPKYAYELAIGAFRLGIGINRSEAIAHIGSYEKWREDGEQK